jgi:hypothetical protein
MASTLVGSDLSGKAVLQSLHNQRADLSPFPDKSGPTSTLASQS